MARKYTYQPAATTEHPNKPGVNRTHYEDNGSQNPNDWTMISKDYLPYDPRTINSPLIAQLRNASPEEIDVIRNLLGIF